MDNTNNQNNQDNQSFGQPVEPIPLVYFDIPPSIDVPFTSPEPIQPDVPAPPPPPKSIGHRLLIILFGIIVGFGAIAGVYYVGRLVADYLDSRTVVENWLASENSHPTTYWMRERPEFARLRDLITGLNQKYQDEVSSGQIWSRLDHTIHNEAYVQQFLDILGDYQTKLESFYSQKSINADELDFEIEYTIFKLDQLEQNFLTGEALDTVIVITREDNSVAVVDKPQPVDGLSAEAWAKTFTGYRGSDGTYKTAADELAQKFGMFLDYEWENVFEKCVGDFDYSVIAAYCHATPEKIYVNKNAQSYDYIIKDVYFISTIKHEIAHHQIGLICRTASPPIAGSLVEGVTSSFANIYMGANLTNRYFENFPEYQITDATERIARQIHDERRCDS
jgi:hypothetical protein